MSALELPSLLIVASSVTILIRTARRVSGQSYTSVPSFCSNMTPESFQRFVVYGPQIVETPRLNTIAPLTSSRYPLNCRPGPASQLARHGHIEGPCRVCVLTFAPPGDP